MNLSERILELVELEQGLTDREIADRLLGKGSPQQSVNQTCNRLAVRGLIRRSQRVDALIGNFSSSAPGSLVQQMLPPPISVLQGESNELCEDDVKSHLKNWLEKRHWATVEVKWGNTHGVDVVAQLPQARWYIEAKGCGSLQPMRVNYFLAVLGELLQRMDDDQGLYSIAFPNLPQYRRLWNGLPALAKQRTQISALFVGADGTIEIDGLDLDQLRRAKGAIRYVSPKTPPKFRDRKTSVN